MTSGGGVVGHRLVGGTHSVAILNALLQLLAVAHLVLLHAHQDYVVVLVFHDVDLVLVVQQVETLAAVDFDEGEEALGGLAGVILDDLEHVVDHRVLYTLHGECLATAGLAVGEASHHPVVEQQVQQGTDHVLVHVLAGLVLVERVVELEVVVLHVLGYAIHLQLALVHPDLRVGHTQGVYLSRRHLLRE